MTRNVLFLCMHNSAPSILPDAVLNGMGEGRFCAYSAGSSPRENQRPNPLALEVLREAGFDTQALYSKRRAAFRQTLHAIRARIALLLALPAEKLRSDALQQSARELSPRE